MHSTKIVTLLLILILSACAPAVRATPTATPVPTETVTPTDTATPLPTATPTFTPTPIPDGCENVEAYALYSGLSGNLSHGEEYFLPGYKENILHVRCADGEVFAESITAADVPPDAVVSFAGFDCPPVDTEETVIEILASAYNRDCKYEPEAEVVYAPQTEDSTAGMSELTEPVDLTDDSDSVIGTIAFRHGVLQINDLTNGNRAFITAEGNTSLELEFLIGPDVFLVEAVFTNAGTLYFTLTELSADQTDLK